jgi:hypothetical protein
MGISPVLDLRHKNQRFGALTAIQSCMMPQRTNLGYQEQVPQNSRDTELAFLALLLRRADAHVGAEFDDEERRNFFLAAGKYFQASWDELEGIQSTGLPWDEIPVVLHVSKHAEVSPEEVTALRWAGLSWHDIMSGFSLHPESVYVPIESPGEDPPSRTYRYQGPTVLEAWDSRTSSDEDIINLVNLKFISGYYGLRPEKIIALHASGWTFSAIHADMRRPEVLGEFRLTTAKSACG